MRIEVYFSPFCRGCGSERPAMGSQGAATVIWKDVTCHLEEAVRLGVARPPAVTVDGRLVAQGPEALRLLDRLIARAEASPDG
ncbi:MAG: glutaredoxin [Chloroflexota bacterium]|nr:glutaredoxin [Chloroflexota bacterium]